MDTELSVQTQDCTRYDERLASVFTSRKQAWRSLYMDNPMEFTKLAKMCRGIMTHLRHIDAKLCCYCPESIHNGREKGWNVLVFCVKNSRSTSSWKNSLRKKIRHFHSVGHNFLAQKYFIIQFPQPTRTCFIN